MKKLILIFLFFSCFLFAHEIIPIGVGYGYTKMTLNEGIICLVRSRPASVLILTDTGQFLSEISSGLSYPTWAVHHAGNVYVNDYHRESVVVYTIFGKFVKRIQVGNYPTVARIAQRNLYVVCSKDPSMYVIDLETLQVKDKFVFDSPTLYFEIVGENIAYLYYYAMDKTLEFIGSERKIVSIRDFRTPIKCVQKLGKIYLLGYMDGKLACLDPSGKILWQQNLDDLARDMLVTEDFIVVTSLAQPRITLLDHSGKIRKYLELPNPTHRLEQIRGTIIALNHAPGELYLVDPGSGKIETIKIGDYAVEMCKTADERLIVLCSDSGELYLIKLSL